MNPVEVPKTGVVALLDDIAPPRVGTLLCSARKQRSLTRRNVANQIGTTASELRRCERGYAPARPGLVAALADCYGADLTAQFATRTPIRLDLHHIVIGTEAVTLESNDADEVLGAYLGIVARLRRAKPGEPIALRNDDLIALSTALGQDSERIEARVAELLDCTLREARSLHSELLRRKVVVPVASLATGLAVVAGVGCTAASPTTMPPHPVPTHEMVVATTPIPSHHTAASTSTTSIVVKAVSERLVPATPQVGTEPPTTPTTTLDIGSALSVVAPTTTGNPHVSTTTSVKPVPRPVITTDTTPMSIPTSETTTTPSP